MDGDPHNQRFFSYLSLFTFMMIILVTSNNYLLMFVGWEGVGVCSYLLVSFWFTRIAANQSSISAFLTNRVGDCFFTIGMFAVLWSIGNLDYAEVFSLAPYFNEDIVTIIGICLLIGAMAKSSQIGLHVWLPMAMEGPTPVSALIHAATMVTAGVYLLMRSSPLIEYSSTVLLLCLWIGGITTIFSSLIGLFQQDIKKVIAYSTMSQLGMMVIAIGLSSYNVALFHLINHAFYKGLLFLGAGAVIHAMTDNQDFRRYGGLVSYLPLTYSVMLIASLSLVAFPFMTGFFSKDFILESAYGQYHFSSISVYIIAVIGAIFTTLYSVKVLYLTFLANPNGSQKHYALNLKNVSHEGDIFLTLPLIILALFSIYFGYITKDIFIGLGSGFFMDNGIFIHPSHEILINTEFGVATLFKLLPFFFTIFFTTLAFVYFEFLQKSVNNFKLSSLGYYIFGFFNQRFLIEFYYNKYIVNLVLNLGGQTTKVLDKGSIENVGPYGLQIIFLKLSKIISKLNSGLVTNYALYILIGLTFYVAIYYLQVPNFDVIILSILFSIGIFTFYTTSYKKSSLEKDSILVSSIFRSVTLNKISRLFIFYIFIFIIRSFIGVHFEGFFNLDSDSSDEETKPKSEKAKGKEKATYVSSSSSSSNNSDDENDYFPMPHRDYFLSKENKVGESSKAGAKAGESSKSTTHLDESDEDLDYSNMTPRVRNYSRKVDNMLAKYLERAFISDIDGELNKNNLHFREDKDLSKEELESRNFLEKKKQDEIDKINKLSTKELSAIKEDLENENNNSEIKRLREENAKEDNQKSSDDENQNDKKKRKN
jgi:NADH-ubiquinone oxidoreductase chain 5